MKIKIIEDNQTYHDKEVQLSLEQCGFRIGDIVEISGEYRDGSLLVNAIRNTEFVSICDEVSIQDGEYEVIEE